MRGQLLAAEAPRHGSARGQGPETMAHAAIAPGFDLRTVALTHEDPVLRRNCPTKVTFNFTDPLHQPPCGTLTPKAASVPPGSTMSLASGTVAVHAGSSIAANGEITLDAAQACGDLIVAAERTITNPGGGTSTCDFRQGFRLRSHPTGIESTSNSTAAVPSDRYGAVFDHVFTSNDGDVASLEAVGIGERFPDIPNPTGASHRIVAPTNPFGGTFTLETATLTDGATNNWFATASGGLNGTQDKVFTQKSGINVQRHAVSTSNPTPRFPLPAKMDIAQHLHWFCPQAARGARWTDFATVRHIRTLQEDGSGGVDFVTEVNGSTQTDPYTGAVAVIGVTPSPATVAPSPAGAGRKGGPPRNTVAIATTSLPAAVPSGKGYTFTIRGNALGSTIARDRTDPTAATVSIGTKTGTITVRAASTGGQFHEAQITIATPAPAAAPPAAAAPDAPAAGGGQ